MMKEEFDDSSDHDHSHGHDHDHSNCDHHSHKAGNNNESHDHGHDHGELPENFKVDDLMNVVQFGAVVHLIHILETCRDLVYQRDSKGNTVVHWAAKRGSIEILKALHDFGAKLEERTTSEPNMLPIHWAAADGKIDSLEFLISKGVDINAQDITGSSAAVIATQYNQIQALIYLYKHGADLTLADQSGDACAHWAAYKGLGEMMQLVLYFHPREISTTDRYGQTPLHLASLRGNHDCVDILVNKYHADYTIRDKSGKNPLELSIEKKQFAVEWIIKKSIHSGSTLELLKKVLLEDRKFLPVLICGSNDIERSVWMWRVTFFSNLYASICLIQFTLDPKFADLFLLHYLNTFFILIWWIMFLGCLWKDPGYNIGDPYGHQKHLPKSHSSKAVIHDANDTKAQRKNNSNSNLTDIEEGKQPLLEEEDLYEKGLNIIARLQSSHYDPILCHSCHVERPLRSKHDKFTNKCVYKFDHYCPFVYNAVGRDNYKFFVGLLFVHPAACLGFVIMNIYYYFRTESISYSYYIFFVYSLLMASAVFYLGSTHYIFIRNNLTTNEYSNQDKYLYLKDMNGRFHNPFNMNSTWKSTMAEAFQPDQRLFYTRVDVIRAYFPVEDLPPANNDNAAKQV